MTVYAMVSLENEKRQKMKFRTYVAGDGNRVTGMKMETSGDGMEIRMITAAMGWERRQNLKVLQGWGQQTWGGMAMES